MVVPADGSIGPYEVGGGREVGPAAVQSLSWSPDSTHVAFASIEGGVSTILIASITGAAPVALTDDTANRDLPTWSPDGAWIAFREKNFDGQHVSLRMYSADGSQVQDVSGFVATDAYVSKLRFRPPLAHPWTYWWSAGFGTATSAWIDYQFGHTRSLYTGAPPSLVDFGVPWSPDGKLVAVLTRSDGVIVADFVDDANTVLAPTHLTSLGPVADCWIDWAPDGTGLYGGSPGDCSRTVLIPLNDPSKTFTLPGAASGVASWQPPAP
jgi:hypothetical protein